MLLTRPSIELIIADRPDHVPVAFPFHEFAHALAAYRLGDSTAKLFGRLTLEPAGPHRPDRGALIDPDRWLRLGQAHAGTTRCNLRAAANGEAIVALAGPASNLVLATAGAMPLRYIVATGADVPIGRDRPPCSCSSCLNVSLMIFNLIPIPPLDGSKVLFAFLDRQTEMQWRPVLEQYGIFILLGAMLLPILPGGERSSA